MHQPLTNEQSLPTNQQMAPPQQIVQMPQAALNPETRTRNNPTTRAKGRRFTGWGQVVCGVLVFLFWIPSAVLECVFYVDGSGVWCGLMFVITGLFGVASAKQKNCRVTTYLVLSVISAVFAGYCTLTYMSASTRERHNYHHYYQSSRDNYPVRVAFDVILLFLSVFEMVLAIVGSSFCCSACCKSPVYQVVVYGAPQPGVPLNAPTVGNVQSYNLMAPQETNPMQNPTSVPPILGQEYPCYPPPYAEKEGPPS